MFRSKASTQFESPKYTLLVSVDLSGNKKWADK